MLVKNVFRLGYKLKVASLSHSFCLPVSRYFLWLKEIDFCHKLSIVIVKASFCLFAIIFSLISYKLMHSQYCWFFKLTRVYKLFSYSRERLYPLPDLFPSFFSACPENPPHLVATTEPRSKEVLSSEMHPIRVLLCWPDHHGIFLLPAHYSLW